MSVFTLYGSQTLNAGLMDKQRVFKNTHSASECLHACKDCLKVSSNMSFISGGNFVMTKRAEVICFQCELVIRGNMHSKKGFLLLVQFG